MSTTVNKRGSESKYVSLFADSRPDVDVTFKDPLLSRPTSHYMVGVDNLTVSSQALSMIEPIITKNHTDLIRVVRKPIADAAAGQHRGLATYDNATAANPAGDPNTDTFETNALNHSIPWTSIRQDLTQAFISSDTVINNIGQLMEELQTVASIVNKAMSTGQIATRGSTGANNVVGTFHAYTPAAGEGALAIRDHLQFRLGRAGQLLIEGTKAFWSVCAIEIPTTQNQFGFYTSKKEFVGPWESTTGRRFLTVDPSDETFSFSNMVVSRTNMATSETPQLLVVQTVFHDSADPVNNPISTVLQGAPPAVGNTFYSGAHAASAEKVVVALRGNIIHGLDRRVAVELGTSLPIKNSPMIAHQKEFPDFVIGRWIWKTPNHYRVNDKGEQSTYGMETSAVREYQGADSRVVFHELMPQSKVQTLRIKIFARVRTFDAATETYNVRSIELPTDATDWWHGRLHFVSKD